MKFEKYLERNMYTPYKYYYIDYSTLSKSINLDVCEYKQLLNENIKLVSGFIKLKIEELRKRLSNCAKNSKSLKKLLKEMKEFTEYVRINTRGLKKVIQRYDKKTNNCLYKEYKKVIYAIKDDVDKLSDMIYKSSELMLKNTKKASIDNSCFVRKTDKYWVHKNNVTTLKFLILQHLPLYVFNNVYDPETHDTNISSVYFDSTDYCLYYDRLRKLQNSEAIRIRWYGDADDIVFIERKRHEDGWTGEVSKKLRFRLYESKVNDFISGEDVWNYVVELNDVTDDLKILYKEIQETIVTKNLRPMVRTCYKRIAFQLPNDTTVRISLDTDLCMVKENIDKNDNWRRINIKYLPKEEIVRFPYGILEVKTQCIEENKPDWIIDMTTGSLVEHVHKFSKYLHGMAVLYPNITEIPYWLPQMATKILKDPFENKSSYKEFDNNQVLIDILPEDKDSLVDSEYLSTFDTTNKKISIPVRVEPKVFFANERTFLSWVQFAIFLGGISTALLGMERERALLGGITLIGVSIVFAFYALYLYLWRAGMIRRRESGPYDDIYGPPILVCVFLFAMFLAIIFKFPLKKVL